MLTLLVNGTKYLGVTRPARLQHIIGLKQLIYLCTSLYVLIFEVTST